MFFNRRHFAKEKDNRCLLWCWCLFRLVWFPGQVPGRVNNNSELSADDAGVEENKMSDLEKVNVRV